MRFNKKKKIKSVVMLVLTALISFSCNTEKRPLHIFMAGDSTMANKVLYKTVTDSVTGKEIQEDFPERGWGMVLPQFFTDKVVIQNYAKNGRSTRTFISEGLWDSIASNVKQGDYVIIQFGHNDSSEAKKDRYTSPGDYKNNLIKFVDETRAKGGNPILCTPVARRKYKDGEIVNTHGIYTDLVAEVATEKNVPLVDMYKYTSEWLNETGEENSARFFMNIPAGVNKIYPNGLTDNTHFVQAGAEKAAGFFVEDIKKQQIEGLTKYLKK
ncbi:hypothetical protein D0T49_09530 [Paludibacter sp. 221]|uniref:rhamnogalacturonan acetylesterase n=1 Tax=Paludibacter sp. 221 TaxID=2302939 RepID=UPI0013D610DF|nr:rhamnogalacturonan acetylesterase [Paludibacter sp. 221]NDV47284.1 hypothetical protein [Paludibacter sp. 221]